MSKGLHRCAGVGGHEDGVDRTGSASWSAGPRETHAERVADLKHWTVDAKRMATANDFLHCLPVRRNVIVTDEVLDGPKSRVVPQAANREPVQAAVLLSWML